MPNNMKKAGMSYKKGGSKKMQAGGGFTYGAGDGDITPQKANMESMAKGGGLKGFMKGGGVMDGMMDKKMKYGGNKGDMRMSAKRDYMKYGGNKGDIRRSAKRDY
mgnify:CR=1 FL=1|tara:strand:- start:2833 stop:3147 length:315 start_codon:yes stop_codon:yes gene_type:complete